MVGGNVDHIHRRDLYSAAGPSRINCLITMMRYGIFSIRWVTASRGSVSGSGDFCWQISINISKTVQDRDGRLIGNRIWPIKWQQRQGPWMTWKVIHQLQAFSNAICRTFMQHFYPNVTTLRSRLCYRKSVCRLFIVYLTLVHPTQGVKAFANISSPLWTFAILWPPCKILRRSSHVPACR